VLVDVDVDGILEASSPFVRNAAELFHRIEVEGMNEFTVGQWAVNSVVIHGIEAKAGEY
jgi:hypothetical protein